MDSIKIKAIVLSSVDYKEKDKLVTLFSLENGVVTATLKFAKEPFCFGDFYISAKTITNVDVEDSFYDLTKDIDKFYVACAILETINPEAVYQTQPFTAPTAATRRTSFFADRRTFAYSNGKSSTSLHYGIDFGCPKGTPVTSCAAGKVVLAETRISTGWSGVIEHLPGLYSLYYHMDSLKVKEGDIVKAGDLVGLSGATGLATGPHLHWEIRLNMAAVSPDFFVQNFTFAEEAQGILLR